MLATLLSLPASANFDIPNDPLTTGARVPPNILFILDDSGSMGWKYMYNPDITSVTGGGINSGRTGNNAGSDNTVDTDDTGINGLYDQSYVTNTLYYNPNTTYTPWLDSTGAPVPGGTSYTAAYSSANYVTHALSGTTSGTTNLSTATRTFYVPKAAASSLSDATQYYRYQILTNQRIVRSERLEAAVSTEANGATIATGLSATTGNFAGTYTINVPSGATNLRFSIAGPVCSGQCANVYARRNNNPTTTNNNCASAGNGNNESCAANTTNSGTWNVRVYAGSSFSGVTLSYSYDTEVLNNTGQGGVGCDTSTSGWGWRNCTYATPVTVAFPSGRSEAAELTNFATWYSFYRTRTKAAKAGASIAFNDLDAQVRVGFRTIHGREGGSGVNNPTHSNPIPVNYNQGLFDNPNGATGSNNNRQRWYNRLFLATANSGTPLRSALNNAGLYFSNRSSSGAYGPESTVDQLACRQNFSILTTDGYWNGDSGFGSGGDQDGTDGDVITSPGSETYQYKAALPYRDGASLSRSNTLADVAMRYWKNDLVDMPNIVPTTAANPAFWQHMVTFGISIGLKGTLDQSSVQQVLADGGPRRAGAAVNWPQPAEDSVNNIDDLLHAAVNGHGTFLSAGNPEEFAGGLKAALAAIVERTGSFSNVAANSTALDAGARVFQANYVSGVWVGEMRSQPVSLAGGVEPVDCTLSTQPSNGWCASKGIPTTGRKVFTSNGHNNGVLVTNGTSGVEFPTHATTAQLASLQRTAPLWQYPVSGVDNAAYIAGNRTLELNQTGELRNRNHLLGDIVGSSPAYVKDTNTLYVGANDGMLHAISAVNGSEQFAYIPGIINWNDLGTLSRQDYGHRYFVDGPIVVTSRQQTPGKNLLVGALGKGGKGLFSLDVTNPAGFGTGGFKWERADTPGLNMGLIQGRPILGKKGSTNVVVLGNGVNSTNSKAVLIVLDLETGNVIREINTGVGTAALPNGLSAPTAVLGADGRTIAYVYAGDMQGNVWKFDLTNSAPAGWTATKVFEAGITRPISGGIAVAIDPKTNKRWLFFGTGRYLTAGDVTNVSTQGIYGVMDGTSTLTASDLTQRTVSVTSGNLRGFQAKAALPATSNGWYINLPEAGERVVQDAQVASTFMITASMIPTGDACESSGRGYVNALDAFTGTSAGASYFDLNGGGTSNDVVGGVPVGSVNLGVGMPTLPNLMRGMLVVGGSAGSDLGAPPTLAPRWDRASWREIRRD
ncbi:MAG: PilC/PilY family type IV pilus protein [Pseudoxanthomonas sp.]|nr:PilC/PilY family type IV pilus protein [Pseudoxanthomonas sp.]